MGLCVLFLVVLSLFEVMFVIPERFGVVLICFSLECGYFGFLKVLAICVFFEDDAHRSK